MKKFISSTRIAYSVGLISLVSIISIIPLGCGRVSELNKLHKEAEEQLEVHKQKTSKSTNYRVVDINGYVSKIHDLDENIVCYMFSRGISCVQVRENKNAQ